MSSSDRAISPVVGGALLLVIVVLLVATSGVMIFALVDQEPAAPTARLDLTSNDQDCTYVLVHRGGDTLDGDRIRIRGSATPNALEGQTLSASDRVRIEPKQDKLSVVWAGPDGDTTYTLASFMVDRITSGGVIWSCMADTLFTSDSTGLLAISGDNGSSTALSATSNVEALGPPQTDLTGDARRDVPFINGSGVLKLTNATNETTTLATSNDISGTIESSKTRIGVGSWNGSGPSVFFINQNHDTIYRVSASGTPKVVATPGNGAQAVVGVGDIDGDGADELVFADSSQYLRYLESDGTTNKTEQGQTGSNNGIGAGALADFDGDGTVSVVAVDGNGNVKFVGEASSEGGEGTTTLTSTDAKKAPITAADVDGDGAPEIVYVGNDNGKLKYVDDVGNTNTVEFLRNEEGNKIAGSDTTGIV